MSLLLIKNNTQTQKESFLIGSEAKNPLPLSSQKFHWSEIAGLSWLFFDDEEQ